MFGEVVSSDEGQDMGLETFQVVIMVDLDGGVLDGSVHPLGLTICPRMVGFGEPMLDVIGDADAVEDVWSNEASGKTVSALGQIGEGHAVVGEHGVDFVGEDVDYVPEEGRAFHLAGTVMELDVSELRHAVDCQEHDQLAVGMPRFATVDMDVSDLVGLEPLALFGASAVVVRPRHLATVLGFTP